MNKFDKIGIGLIVIGFLIPFFIFMGGIIGVPIFIIGAITLSFGTLKLKQKLIWILIPLILYYPIYKAYYEITFYFANIQKVDLILPVDFKGTAIIIDNTDFGQIFEKKQRREQIVFDKNGIAFYPTELELQSSRFRVFTKQKNGELKRILLNSDSSNKTTLLAYGESSFEKTIESENKYIPYDFVKIGESFTEQSNSEKRCELIDLIKKGEIKTVYNKMYN
ncbi:hypothetical protein [Winogradskyella immobilis]|uniref:Uncharacterized protein n=1 Tax=Winogradskyella immobilis TaxID=2816852 RepID=A0ABS8ESR1_9FLAO|nr:hypothetical protein [Winogradskyella immobilis]MCC1485555.1 hypothetical protein [Winogradskyella immobilis]MCG0017647.1 hypothetical protein [Winogradskyella immobilis]